jgi:hypothetical protein
MSNFILRIEALGGSDIKSCAEDAVNIANKLNVVVGFDFNGVKCLACPGDSAKQLSEAAMALVDQPKPGFNKTATGH